MPAPVVGIDTVRWGGPVHSVDNLDDLRLVEDLASVELTTGELSHKRIVGRLPGGGTMWLYYEGARITSARIEASLPKVLTGSNFTLTAVPDALSVMEILDETAGQYVEGQTLVIDLPAVPVRGIGGLPLSSASADRPGCAAGPRSRGRP